MHSIIHKYSDGTKRFGEKLKEIPQIFLVQYWPWTEYSEPQPMVIARYELVEVIEGELPAKEMSNLTRRIAVKIEEEL